MPLFSWHTFSEDESGLSLDILFTAVEEMFTAELIFKVAPRSSLQYIVVLPVSKHEGLLEDRAGCLAASVLGWLVRCPRKAVTFCTRGLKYTKIWQSTLVTTTLK